jgi:hypothetical protein
MSLLSINQAAAQGVERLRLPIWANPLDHLKVDILEGQPGPWTHLFSPYNQPINGRDPMDVLCISMDYEKEQWEIYTGPLPTSDEYLAIQKKATAMWPKDEERTP